MHIHKMHKYMYNEYLITMVKGFFFNDVIITILLRNNVIAVTSKYLIVRTKLNISE